MEGSNIFDFLILGISVFNGTLIPCVIFFLSRRYKKEDLATEEQKNSKIQFEKSIDTRFNDIESDIEHHSSRSREEISKLKDRLREIEKVNVTEQMVKELLKEGMIPVKDNLERLERDMKQDYRSITDTFTQSHTNLQDAITKLAESVNYIRGKMETEGK